jgi:hypothetical protein
MERVHNNKTIINLYTQNERESQCPNSGYNIRPNNFNFCHLNYKTSGQEKTISKKKKLLTIGYFKRKKKFHTL